MRPKALLSQPTTGKLSIILSYGLLLLSLAACGQKPLRNAGISDGSGHPATASEIQQQLSAICPLPTKWTPEQMIVVADFIDAHGAEPGGALLAAEWERLRDASRICRGVK